MNGSQQVENYSSPDLLVIPAPCVLCTPGGEVVSANPLWEALNAGSDAQDLSAVFRGRSRELLLSALVEGARKPGAVLVRDLPSEGNPANRSLQAAIRSLGADRQSPLLVVFWDITVLLAEKSAAEKAVAEKRAKLDLALEVSNSGFWDWNLPDDHLEVDDRFLDLLGYRREEFWLRGWDFFQDATAQEDRQQLFLIIQSHLAGEAGFDAEARLKCAGGQYLWVRIRGKALERDEATGSARRLIGTLSDISRQQEIRERVENARHAAERANRAKSQFIASLSHELRTPITSIIGYAELLGEDVPEALYRSYARNIAQAGRSLTAILEDIMDLSRAETGQVFIQNTPADLGGLVQDIADLFGLAARDKGLRLNVEISPHLPAQLCTDCKRLRQIIYNLVSNAVKFTEEGEITLTLEGQPATPDDPDLWDVILRVQDTGPGVDPAECELIFEPFQQGRAGRADAGQGRGLGLAISKQLAEALGGTLQYGSRSEKGSTFSLWLRDLPVPDQEIALPTATEAAAAKVPDLERSEPAEAFFLMPDNPAECRQLARQLREKFLPRWKTLQEFWDFEALRQWAHDLEHFASESRCGSLTQYARQILESVQNYDVRQLRSQIKVFDNILQTLDDSAD